jgi:hypothetical protein
VFGIECVFFLRMYRERRPERRERLDALLRSRRGAAVTTPDTLLPTEEARGYEDGLQIHRCTIRSAEPNRVA